MPSPRKILFVCPETPGPTGTGGPVRSWHVMLALARQHAVTSLVLNNDGLEMDAELGRFCQGVIRPPAIAAQSLRPSRWRSLLKTAGVLAFPWQENWETLAAYAGQHCDGAAGNGAKRSTRLLSTLLWAEIHLAAARFTPPPMLTLYAQNAAGSLSSDTKARLAEEKFDVVWFEFSFCHPVVRKLLPADQRPLLVCDAHNVEFELQRRCAALADTPTEARWLGLQSDLLKQVESAAFRSCDLTLACSKYDADVISQLAPDASVLVVPNGVDTDHFRPRPDARTTPEPTVLFTGNFGYQPNCDAVKWFVGDVFPRIKKAVPNCRFVFAGRGAQSAFDRFPVKPEGVQCVSDPADIRPQFEGAWVFVAPVRAGGGTRLKILEAMAMQRAVVSTRVGAAGVPYTDGEHVLLADTPDDFANAVLRLIANKTLRAQLAGNAALWVRQNYNWPDLCENAVKTLDQMLSIGCESWMESNPENSHSV
jgi:polysaccharide biosynthesis protein PslH